MVYSLFVFVFFPGQQKHHLAMFFLGVNIPDNKIVSIALTSIHGVGRQTGARLCNQLLIHPQCRLKDLPEDKVTQLSTLLNGMTIETELKKQVADNISKMVQIGSYKGLRHKAGMPVNGGRTRTNAQTAKRINKGRLSIGEK
jgi:small subunit ribosomal protein S13